jgi:hypothetical protein
MLLNPLAWISAKVEATTGGLFHDPSVGVASSVFPKFHPGFRPANATEAVIGVNIPVQEDLAVAEAELVDIFEVEVNFEVDDDFDVDEETEELFFFVESVVAVELNLLDVLEVSAPLTLSFL